MADERLPVVARKISDDIEFLEQFKEQISALPTIDLVDGYVVVKDLGKKIDSISKLSREELLDIRFENEAAEIDEKGNKYLYGGQCKLKAERRVMKPVLDQERAYKFFEEKGLLHKVSDVNITLRSEEIEDILYVLKSFSSRKSKLFEVLGIGKTESTKEMKSVLNNILKTLEEKGEVFINEEKVSALVALEEISMSEIEHLFDYKETWALKEVKK